MRAASRRDGRLHVLLLSNTVDRMSGADRDFVNLIDAFAGEAVRWTWAGMRGTECLRPHLDPSALSDLVDLHFPFFTYLIQENARQPRSAWLWTKILADHLLRLRAPLRRLVGVVRADPPDLVVTNTCAVTVGALLAKQRGLPHVWCVKECLDPEVPACRTLARWICRLSARVTAPSRAVAAVFPPGVEIVPDGSPVAQIRTSAARRTCAEILRELELPEDRPVVAQVGGLVWWKGQHVTAEAFVRLSERGAEPPFSLLFLGDGDKGQRAALERILARAPSPWRGVVRFTRFPPDDFAYLAAADLVVHPSVLPDPLPNAVREALALGKPVIGSNDGGIPELIRDGETGLLVPSGDPEALADAIERLVRAPGERERLGRAAWADAGERFDIRTRKDAFLALFREAAGGRGRA